MRDMNHRMTEQVTGGSVTTPPATETLADKRARVERERAEIIAAQKREREAKRAAVKEQRERLLVLQNSDVLDWKSHVDEKRSQLADAERGLRLAITKRNATRQLLGLPCREKKGTEPEFPAPGEAPTT